MQRTHYKLWYRYNAVDRCLLWYSDEHDGIVDIRRPYPLFSNGIGVACICRSSLLLLEAEAPGLHDLDLVQTWLADPQPHLFHPHGFLNAWNLFGDVARTLPAVEARFTEPQLSTWASLRQALLADNLPAVTTRRGTFCS